MKQLEKFAESIPNGTFISTLPIVDKDDEGGLNMDTFCDKKASQCGGTRKKNCKFYGDRGSRFSSRPTEDQLKEAKRIAKKEKVSAHRKKTKGSN